MTAEFIANARTDIMLAGYDALLKAHAPVQVYKSADDCGHEFPPEPDWSARPPEGTADRAEFDAAADAWDAYQDDHPYGTTQNGENDIRICMLTLDHQACPACSALVYSVWGDDDYIDASRCVALPLITAALSGEETPRVMTGRMSHASNPRARKKAREGERRMHTERQQAEQAAVTPEQARARLEEIAPAISQETPRSAEALARQVGVDAQRCLQRALDPARSGHRDWKRIGYGYAMVHLLAVLRQQAPEVADAAARSVIAAWSSARTTVLLGRALEELGIDPEEIRRLEGALPDGKDRP